MENLTHTLAGLVLSKAGLERKTPLATPVLVIAANLPDIDVLGGFFGGHYLDFHRGVTHGLVGIACLSVVLAVAFSVISRARKSHSTKFIPLLYVSFLGLISHPFLDFLNDYGVRPWLPFSGRKYYGDLISVVDPWLWIIFGSGLFLLARSERGKLGWVGLGLILAALIVLGGGPIFALAWVGVLALALLGGHFLRRQGFQTGKVALILFFIYLGGTSLARESVVRSARDVGPGLISESVRKIDVLPRRPGAPPNWTVVMETTDSFYLADVRLQNWRRYPPQFQRYVKNLQDPCYQESLSQAGMAAMSRFARFPSVEVQAAGNKCTVFLRDLRYNRKSITGWGVASATVLTEPGPTRPAP